MTTQCLQPEEVMHLVEGDLPKERGDQLRAHAEGCATCGAEVAQQRAVMDALRAPVESAWPERDVAAVMRRLDGPPPRESRLMWWVMAPSLAAAAALALVVMPGTREQRPDMFAARGTATSPVEAADVRLVAVGPPAKALADGDKLSSSAALTASYRSPGAAVQLMVFAVDAKGEVHWLFPEYRSAAEDPASVSLPAARDSTVLSESVVLDAPAAGPLRVIAIVSAGPLRVSAIESLPKESLTVEALRARWPSASVRQTQLTVEP